MTGLTAKHDFPFLTIQGRFFVIRSAQSSVLVFVVIKHRTSKPSPLC
jgi:hypothetical protein